MSDWSSFKEQKNLTDAWRNFLTEKYTDSSIRGFVGALDGPRSTEPPEPMPPPGTPPPDPTPDPAPEGPVKPEKPSTSTKKYTITLTDTSTRVNTQDPNEAGTYEPVSIDDMPKVGDDAVGSNNSQFVIMIGNTLRVAAPGKARPDDPDALNFMREVEAANNHKITDRRTVKSEEEDGGGGGGEDDGGDGGGGGGGEDDGGGGTPPEELEKGRFVFKAPNDLMQRLRDKYNGDDFDDAIQKFAAFVGPFYGPLMPVPATSIGGGDDRYKGKDNTDKTPEAEADARQRKDALDKRIAALRDQIFEGGLKHPVAKIIDTQYIRANRSELVKKWDKLRQQSPKTAEQIYKIANLSVGTAGKTKPGEDQVRHGDFLTLMRSLQWDPNADAVGSYTGDPDQEEPRTDKQHMSSADRQALRQTKSASVGSSTNESQAFDRWKLLAGIKKEVI
jgi:hypothetical protein